MATNPANVTIWIILHLFIVQLSVPATSWFHAPRSSTFNLSLDLGQRRPMPESA